MNKEEAVKQCNDLINDFKNGNGLDIRVIIVVNLPNTKPTSREKLFAQYIEQLQKRVEELEWINEEQMIINRELKK